jgi:hypothetical protein
MGQGRSLRKLAADAKTTSKLRQLQHWSSRWKWVERCQRYDDYLENQDRLQQEKERREMHKRHARMGMLAQNLAVRNLERMINDFEKDQKQGIATPIQVARILEIGVKVERLARGEPTDSHEVSGPSGGPVKLSLKETLAQLRASYGLAPEGETDDPLRASNGTGTPDPKA